MLLSINVIRTAHRWYVQRGDEAIPIDAAPLSTAAFLAEGWKVARAASVGESGVPAEGLSLLSPVTAPCRVVAQAVNYRSHGSESGVGADPPSVFFRKSSASISGPADDVVRPRMCGSSTTSWSWAS